MIFTTRLVSVLASVVLLSGCAEQAPSATPTPVDYMGCILADNFGVDDQTVGSTSFLGALQAQAQFGIKLRKATVSANASYNEYAKAFESLLENDCDIVVAIGSAAEITENRASDYPNVNFIEVHGRPYQVGDATGINPDSLKNVRSLSYDSAQGGFLAGYLAATQTESKVIGAFGSTLNRAETAILAGFSQGVRYANEINSTSVKLLGQANANSDYWVAVGLANSVETAERIKSMVTEGADVILPVVGGTMSSGPGIAAATTAGKSSTKVSIIGSFTDWYASEAAGEIHGPILASVALSIQKDVAAAIGQDINGDFVGGQAGNYLGTLRNGGVYLAGANEITLNGNYLNQVAELERKIAEGTIVVRSALQ
jgi:basic membrane protein A